MDAMSFKGVVTKARQIALIGTRLGEVFESNGGIAQAATSKAKKDENSFQLAFRQLHLLH